MFQKVSIQGPLEGPPLGSSLPVLTKGGRFVEEMGVDFQKGQGEVDQMASQHP